MTHEGFTERLCYLNGAKPTPRERWKAFHRLFRLSQGHGPDQDMAAGECFRILYGSWRAILLLDDYGPGPDAWPMNSTRYPIFLRKRLLENAKRKRLYGNHPEWKERDKVVARHVRDKHGMEVTPTEVAEVRRKVINLARAKAAELDFTLPKDDEEVLRLLKPRAAL